MEKGLRIVLPRASLAFDWSGLRVKRHWTQVRCLLHRSQPVPIRNSALIGSRVTQNERHGPIIICPSLGKAWHHAERRQQTSTVSRVTASTGGNRCFRTSTAALHLTNAPKRRTQNITSVILAFLCFSFRKHLFDIELLLNRSQNTQLKRFILHPFEFASSCTDHGERKSP